LADVDTIDCRPRKEVKVYGSAYESVSFDMQEVICNLIKYGQPPRKNDNISLVVMDVDIIIIIIKVPKKPILHIKCLVSFNNLEKELSRNRYIFIALLKLSTLSLCLMASGS